jgi:hypothetical protein
MLLIKLFYENYEDGGTSMNLIFFHNWYYAAEGGEERAIEAMEAIKQNMASFPFGSNNYEIASAEAKVGGDHYWLLLFLVSSDEPGDDSAAIRNKIESWLDSIDVWGNDDRTTMTPQFGTLQECLESRYPGAYTLHTVIRKGGPSV